jgi:SNF2 family DNA or RNA helicase
LSWAQAAWRAGLPGILNADEQGLGKTLQTIAFLAWLKERLAEEDGPCRGPVLVVAPTSLLENWEVEVSRHLEAPGLGTLVRLFGSGTAAFRKAGARGRDTDDATDRLDFTVIHEAMAEGRAHRMWMLTTYQTLTNYQHSLGRIPFSAIVFDEIQALKNPGTLAAKAAKAMNGDFRIGLTGTPVENNITDLWAVMDQLAPGYLGPLNDFRSRFRAEDPDPDLLGELHNLVFAPQGDRPAFALRRLKEDAAAHLPEKARFLHPARMPPVQAEAYESARAALAGGGLGAALKMLQRIRGVSLHPDPGMEEGFESASARLSGALKILDRVREAGERALVFIEDRRMQHRFVALARARYGLNRIDIINGNTPIRQRQAIVDRFQELRGTRTFSFLVLGPRAAGTGLTLTAATHVIHLSRWWNPAVEEQCNDRVHRIGQDSPVSIHMPMSVHPRYGTGSFDCQLQILMERKRRLARQTLFPAGETREDADQLRRGLVGDSSASGDVDKVIGELFTAMNRDRPRPLPDGSYPV